MVRRARVYDVPQIAEIISPYVRRGILLPVSPGQLYERLRMFVVYAQGNRVIACGALHVIWTDLGEIRSLAVREGEKGGGIGRQIVEVLLQDARKLGLRRVFALTYESGFFERLGFHVIAKETLPPKIWKDCIHCLRFPDCNEIAVMQELFRN